MTGINLNAATRWGINVLLLLSGVMALYLARSILIPTVIALLLAALLWPAANWLNRNLRLPWTLSCSIVVGGTVIIALIVPVGFGLPIPKLLQGLPTGEEEQDRVYKEFRKRLEAISPLALDKDYFPEKARDSKALQYMQQTLDPSQPYILSGLWQLLVYGGSWVLEWILIMFLLLFLLLEGRMLTRRVVEIFGPSQEAQTAVVDALKAMAYQVRTYLVWRTLVNIGLAVILGLFYQWIGLSQPWTWATLIGVLCYIPYLGPIAAGIPPVIDAFVTCPHPGYAVAVIVVYLIVINVEGYLVVPVVMGRPMQLNATTVLLSCLFWHLVWGTPGLFLAMPLMAAIKAICAHVPGWDGWANLMSTREPKPKEVTPELWDENGAPLTMRRIKKG